MPAPDLAARISPISANGLSTTTAPRILVCPSLSMSRPWTGSEIAVAIAKAASTTPAIAKDPVSPRTSRMIASDIPAIGIRSIAVPIMGCLASRIARIRLYRSPLTRPRVP